MAPSFAPSDDVKGIVWIENNGTTVKNSRLPNTDVYAVHDLTDNDNGKDSSSLMAAKNRLTISDHSTVGEVAHITLEGPYLHSQNIIQNNETYVENSTVNGAFMVRFSIILALLAALNGWIIPSLLQIVP